MHCRKVAPKPAPHAAHAGRDRSLAREGLSKKESRRRLTWDKYVDINLISQAELDAPQTVYCLSAQK
ncbi:hypothetical protein AGR6A_Cc120105 [Agrobacterium sp. NCPPB 925]|nr:hypothetical protein AGR6A_Cc120105 [Agrobacterium sp. NCPPB 925]